MSSLTEKLDYLNETKQLIRDSIVQRGQVIDDSTPFRDYASKILNIDTQSDFIDNRTVVLDFVYQDDGYYMDKTNPDDYKVDTTVLCIGNLYSADYVLEKTAFVIYQIVSVSSGNAHCKVVDILDEYNSSGVKLFSTKEEMQADTTAKEGDLAIVYRSEIQNMNVDSQIQYITFPETVTLSEAFTGPAFGMIVAVDDSIMFNGQIVLDQNSFRFNGYSDIDMIRVSYTSTDGITYTRKEFIGGSGELSNPVNLGTVAKFDSNMGDWNDVFGDFLLVSSMVFDGLFKNQLDTNTIQFLNLSAISITNININNKTAEVSFNNSDKNTLEIDKSKLVSIIKEEPGFGGASLYIDSNNNLMYSSALSPLYDLTGNFIGYTLNGYYSNASADFYKIDLEEGTMTKAFSKSANTRFYTGNSSTYYYLPKEDLDCVTIPTYISENGNTYSFMAKLVATSSAEANIIYVSNLTYDYQGLKTVYLLAENQYTLDSASQLLEGIIAYGKSGNVTGDGSIWSTMTPEQFRALVYGTSASDDSVLVSSLYELTGTPENTSYTKLLGLDYNLSESVGSDYVYSQSLLRCTEQSFDAPSAAPTSYMERSLFCVSRDEIYVLFSQTSRTLLLYKYHLDENNSLVYDYDVDSSISTTTFAYQQPVCRYKDGVLYIVCTTGSTDSSTSYPSLITYNTKTKEFNLVNKCSTKGSTNGIIDFVEDTGICYFNSSSNIYKWDTSGTSAVSIVSDSFSVGDSSSCDGVVEYTDSEYFAVLGLNNIYVINRNTGEVSTISDDSGIFNKQFSRGRFIQIDKYMYIFGCSSGTYVAKIDLNTMTLVKSVFNSGFDLYLRGKSPKSMFVCSDTPNVLYIRYNESYATNFADNNLGVLVKVNLDSLITERLNCSFGSNCGICLSLIDYNSSYLIQGHSFKVFSFDEYYYKSYLYGFVICNVTDFLHGDMPAVPYGSYTVLVNPVNYNLMLNNLDSQNIYNQALFTAKQIEGSVE